MQRGGEHRGPARPRGDDAIGDRFGEVARGERVDADGQVRSVSLQRTDRYEDHGPGAVERVQGRRGHLFQQMNAQKLLPLVAASHSVLARSSSPTMIWRSATSRRA